MVLLFVPIKKYLLFVCVFNCSILIPVLTIEDVLEIHCLPYCAIAEN